MKFYLLFLVIFTSFLAQSQQICKVYEHIYRFGEPVKKGNLVYSLSFNKNDEVAVKTFHTSSGKVKNSIKYTYNSLGNVVKEVKLSRRNSIVKTKIYKYDESNRILQEIIYDSRGKLDKKTEYVYDDEHKFWKTRKKYNSNSMYSKTVVEEFTEEGYRKSGKVYKSNNSVKLKFEIESHDKFGNELEKVFYKPDGKYYLRISSKWDDNNNLIGKIYEGKYKHKFFYNSENKLIKEIHYNPNTNEASKLFRFVYK